MNTIITTIFYIFDTILCLYLICKYFKIAITFSSILLFIIIYLQFLAFDISVYIYTIVLTLFLYLYFIKKIKSLEALLLPLFFVAIHIVCYSLEKLFTPNTIEYTNSYERIVLQIIVLLAINKVVFSLKTKLNNKAMMHFCIGLFSAIFLLLFFVNLAFYKTVNNLDIYFGAFSTIILLIILAQCYLLISNSTALASIYKQNLDKKTYSLLNQVEIKNSYNKSTKISHNMKYMLMNIKLYIDNQQILETKELIDSYLNIINTNCCCFTNNPYLDYIINCFDKTLGSMKCSVVKDICISQNSFINAQENGDLIKRFLDEQLTILLHLNLHEFRLIIHEKGDFISIKAIYSSHIPLTINSAYKLTNSTSLSIVSTSIENTKYN